MANEIKRQHQQHRLVLIPPPLQGHITPMLQLAIILHSKGFSITIAHARFNSPDPTKHPHFTFLPFSDGLSDSFSISSNNFMDISIIMKNNCVTPLKDTLLNLIKKEKVACVIYDGFMYFADSVAGELDLPRIMFRTTSATNFLAYHYLPQLQTNGGYLPSQDSRSLELVPGHEPLRFKDLPLFNMTSLEEMVKRMAESLSMKPMGVIFNTVECLESKSLQKLCPLYGNMVFPIGPLHVHTTNHAEAEEETTSILEEDRSCMGWLDRQPKGSVLYVSLGSIASWDERELGQVGQGLAGSGQRFLWVIRDGTGREWVPEEARWRGMIVKWAPQREVLAHEAVGGFWSHCGWNSCLESLCEGVPVMCHPCFGDQRVNARLLTHVWRVGLEWVNADGVIRKGEVEDAVRRLMVGLEGKAMRDTALLLKDHILLSVTSPTASFQLALNRLINCILSPKQLSKNA